MTDDFYRLAIEAIRHHLEQAGTDYELDDGELVVDEHRLGLSITFEEFVEQSGQIIAPLDIQIHLDSDAGDRFRVGTLGVGGDRSSAMQAAITEWHLLAASPVLAALGAKVGNRRRQHPAQLAGWDLFPGRAGVRGPVPQGLMAGGDVYQAVFRVLHGVVSSWPMPAEPALRSVYLMVACRPDGCDVQAAVDGYQDEGLSRDIAALAWPRTNDAYLYKQLFVLRSRSGE